MSYTLSPYEVVRVNYGMFRKTDKSVEEAWTSPANRMQLHGFTPESATDVDLKRLFTTNVISYIFINIQNLLGIFTTDTQLASETFCDRGFLTRQSRSSRRCFKILRHFKIYDQVTCRPTDHYLPINTLK